MTVPKRIWLSFNNQLTSVLTRELEFVDDLAEAIKNKFSRSLCVFDSTDITLHVDEHAEALNKDSALAEIAAQLSRCSVPETPLIVKGEPPSSFHPFRIQALVLAMPS
jgi:hypothetical protein